MIPIIKTSNDLHQFILEIVDLEDHFISVKAHKVTAWDNDDKVLEYDFYLSAYIKWDGCSDFQFGDDGYLHLCSKFYYDIHCELMNYIWEVASLEIKKWDPN